jgi:predicted nucleic acid-binding protein
MRATSPERSVRQQSEGLVGDIYAVLDTCILLPSPIYNTLLYIAGHHVYMPIWTDLILEELRRNLLEPDDPRHRKTPEQTARRLAAMSAAFEPRANLDRQGMDYRSLIATMPNHPKDRHVLAAAVAVEADYLVTENTRDFRLAGTDYAHVRVVTADRFLCALFAASPWHRLNTLSALHKQVRDSQRLTTLDSLLDKLAAHNRVTAFARQVRESRETIDGLPGELVKAILEGRRVSAQTLAYFGFNE